MKIGTCHLIALCCPRGNYGILKFEENVSKNHRMVKSTNTHIRQKLKKMLLDDLYEHNMKN